MPVRRFRAQIASPQGNSAFRCPMVILNQRKALCQRDLAIQQTNIFTSPKWLPSAQAFSAFFFFLIFQECGVFFCHSPSFYCVVSPSICVCSLGIAVKTSFSNSKAKRHKILAQHDDSLVRTVSRSGLFSLVEKCGCGLTSWFCGWDHTNPFRFFDTFEPRISINLGQIVMPFSQSKNVQCS